MQWIPAFRLRRLCAPLAVCGIGALSACGAHYTQVPARLSLQPYGQVALVTFRTEQPNPGLGASATQRFAEAVLAGQSGVELLEISTADTSLRGLPPMSDPAAFAQALGRQRHVPAVFLGELKMSRMKPKGLVSGAGDVDVHASVSGELMVRLVSTSSGGTLWRSSSAASGTVGHVSLASTRELPAVAVRDPNEAYGEIVDQLVHDVTRDLRPTLVKQ